jgi:hypothetical protein
MSRRHGYIVGCRDGCGDGDWGRNKLEPQTPRPASGVRFFLFPRLLPVTELSQFCPITSRYRARRCCSFGACNWIRTRRHDIPDVVAETYPSGFRDHDNRHDGIVISRSPIPAQLSRQPSSIPESSPSRRFGRPSRAPTGNTPRTMHLFETISTLRPLLGRSATADDGGDAQTHHNQAPAMLGAIWPLVLLAALFIWLRIYCKHRRHRGLWWDDYVLVASWVGAQNIGIPPPCRPHPDLLPRRPYSSTSRSTRAAPRSASAGTTPTSRPPTRTSSPSSTTSPSCLASGPSRGPRRRLRCR